MSTNYRTPPQVARERGVKDEKVLKWIASGELEAINLATRPDGRPRWRISEEALERFDRRRSSRPAPTTVRKRRQSVPRYV